MGKIKKVYIDSRYKTNDSVSNSGFKSEIKEALDLLDNTVWYIDGIPTPHTWYSVEDYNNQFYIDSTNHGLILKAYVLTVTSGNYTASPLATMLNNLLQTRFPNDNFPCVYNVGVCTIIISSTMGFRIMTDEFVKTLQGISSWHGNDDEAIGHPDYHNFRSVNEVPRYSTQTSPDTSFGTDFIDLLNVHNIYTHRCNLGHYSSVGVRGENTFIKQVPVSPSIGYLIMDSAVAPHGKTDVSRQLVKTIEFSFRNVHGKYYRPSWRTCEFLHDLCNWIKSWL